MKPKLIGLYSPAPQAGKSTVAEHLCRAHGYQQLAFAGPLKEMTDKFLECLGVPEAERVRMVYGDLKEMVIPELDRTPRHLMQTLGTEWGRDCVHTDVWAKLTLARAAASERPVVIDDMRFPNELRAVLAAGGVVVKVTREGAARQTSHSSEGQLDSFAGWHCHMLNNLTIDVLRLAVDTFVEHAS